jgi:hypothetical protein
VAEALLPPYPPQHGEAIPRPLTVRDLREALADLPEWLPVDLVVDVALAGSGDGVETPEDFDVALLAPVYAVERGEAGLEVRVDWRRAG